MRKVRGVTKVRETDSSARYGRSTGDRQKRGVKIAASPTADVSDPAERVIDGADAPVVLFDGVCSLCNAVVRFVVRNDSNQRVSFAPLESPVGQALIDRFDISTDAVVLVERDRVSVKSTAALRLARYLDAPWPLAARLQAVPRPIRDAVYDAVAASRYRLFGRMDQCPIPDADTRERFLDGAFSHRE